MSEQYPVVPNDMWICCLCNQGNLIPLADQQCPVCGHWRDATCIEPGQQYSTAAIVFSDDHRSPHSHGHLTYIDCHDTTPQPYCSPVPHHVVPKQYTFNRLIATLGGAGSPAPGAWICTNCGSANCALTPDFCGACGAYRYE
ncbi:hypothetical protein CC80DRAFT_503492 [Byssothecium circinans]|uniref:RanBP2-type domain-containing protein n=1 Tax=Byssothecium circinans TaxID=147558 RepID=A0A6A5U032_9PLEO|nr:hypothetical protein CC80DRAFT_503492 [Byssothecium circinans]